MNTIVNFSFWPNYGKDRDMAESNKIKMAVLIGMGGRLKAICDCVRDIPNIEIVAVVSHKPESPGIEWAKGQGLNAFYFRLSDISPRAESRADNNSEIANKEIGNDIGNLETHRQRFNLAIADKLKALGVNFIVMAGWNIVMNDDFLKRFPGQVINIHPSLLPSFPGPWNLVSRQVLESGVRFTGCTLHFVPDSGVDSGPIILQAVISVEQDETIETLRKKMDVEEEKLLREGTKLFAEGKLKIEGKKVIILP
ncbi:MAG: formyltransferase family protein [bacterium]